MKQSALRFVVGFATVALTVLSARAAETFNVDPVHSFVVFNIKHLDLGQVWGRFVGPTGKIVVDKDHDSKSSLEMSVNADALATDNPARDKHLKGPDFFDARQFPSITFKSTSFKKSGDDAFEVTGDLTLHGVTKPLTIKLTKLGEGDKGPQFKYRAGYATQFTIKRSDFGMTALANAVGDEVNLFVNFEGVRE